MYTPESFYESYFSDHFLYKAFTLKNIIDGFEDVGALVLANVTGIVERDYIGSLRAELRATCFAAIETLFELVFALAPKDGVVNDRSLWYSISTSDWRNNLKSIEGIASGNVELLDTVLRPYSKRNNGSDDGVTYGQHLFYFGLENDEKLKPHLLEGLESLKRFLTLIAQEYSNRDEYNALKHSMRIFPMLGEFRVGLSPELADSHLLIDGTGSMSYLVGEKGGGVSVHTVPMDTERDFRLTVTCSQLIGNIINTRRRLFVSGADQELAVQILNDDALVDLDKRNTQFQSFRFTLSPIIDPPPKGGV